MADVVIAGRYDIVSSLGRGGMGEVFLANDLVLRRRVAIKQIMRTDEVGPDAIAAERLVREARLAASLHHPHVVAVHDLVTDNGRTYMVMEYVPSRSLAELIRARSSLDPVTVGTFGAQIASALEAAHRAGIVHRDVKPSNILIDDHQVAKLADFGVARSSADTSLTGTGVMVGSVAFMAPEVARGGQATPAADIYSLGSTLFAAVEGRPPFAGEGEASSPVSMLARLVTEEAVEAVHGGPLTGLIRRMMASDPAERPTAAEVRRSLALLAAPTPSPLVPAGGGPLGVAPGAGDAPGDPGAPGDPDGAGDADGATVRRPFRVGAAASPQEPGEAPPDPATARRRRRLVRGGLAAVAAVVLLGGGFAVVQVMAPHPATRVSATITVGRNPDQVAVTPDGTGYVPNTGDGTVSVIKGDRVTAVVAVGSSPDAPAVAPDGTVYVTNVGDGTVSVIRGSQVTATIAVGRNPYLPVVAPDGTVYVPSNDQGTLSVVKGTQVTDTFVAGVTPLRPAVAPDGTVYVPNNDPTVSVIRDGRIVAAIVVGAVPSRPAVAPDGTVYVTNSGDRTVSVIRDGRVSATVAVGAGPLRPAVGRDGAVYVTNKADGTVSVIRDARVTATVAVGRSPFQPAVAPDGTVYVTNGDDATVSVIAGARVTATIPVGRTPLQPAVAPDGTVYVTNQAEGTVSVLR